MDKKKTANDLDTKSSNTPDQSEQNTAMLVTIIYYDVDSLELKSQLIDLELDQSGTIIIPEAFKKNKSIVAVCEGEVSFLNTIGDRSDPLKFSA